MNLKYQFDSSTQRIVAGVSSTLGVRIDSIIVYQKVLCFSFFFKDLTKTIRILALDF